MSYSDHNNSVGNENSIQFLDEQTYEQNGYKIDLITEDEERLIRINFIDKKYSHMRCDIPIIFFPKFVESLEKAMKHLINLNKSLNHFNYRKISTCKINVFMKAKEGIEYRFYVNVFKGKSQILIRSLLMKKRFKIFIEYKDIKLITERLRMYISILKNIIDTLIESEIINYDVTNNYVQNYASNSYNWSVAVPQNQYVSQVEDKVTISDFFLPKYNRNCGFTIKSPELLSSTLEPSSFKIEFCTANKLFIKLLKYKNKQYDSCLNIPFEIAALISSQFSKLDSMARKEFNIE